MSQRVAACAGGMAIVSDGSFIIFGFHKDNKLVIIIRIFDGEI
jgi:hypothetical protein